MHKQILSTFYHKPTKLEIQKIPKKKSNLKTKNQIFIQIQNFKRIQIKPINVKNINYQRELTADWTETWEEETASGLDSDFDPVAKTRLAIKQRVPRGENGGVASLVIVPVGDENASGLWVFLQICETNPVEEPRIWIALSIAPWKWNLYRNELDCKRDKKSRLKAEHRRVTGVWRTMIGLVRRQS